jgi:hypothetical protein
MTANLVMDGAAFLQRDLDHGALGGFGGLADGFRHFTRLAMTETNLAGAVADHDQGRESEAAATLHDLGDAVDVNQLFNQIAVFFLPAATTAATAVAVATTSTAIATTAPGFTAGFRRRLLFAFACHIAVL